MKSLFKEEMALIVKSNFKINVNIRKLNFSHQRWIVKREIINFY